MILNLGPGVFVRRPSDVSLECFSCRFAPRSSGPAWEGRRRRARAPAVCLLQHEPAADFTCAEEQTEPLMEAVFPNGMKSSLSKTLHGSAERRDTSPPTQQHQQRQEKVGPPPPLPPFPRCSAQLSRATARFAEQLDAENL